MKHFLKFMAAIGFLLGISGLGVGFILAWLSGTIYCTQNGHPVLGDIWFGGFFGILFTPLLYAIWIETKD